MSDVRILFFGNLTYINRYEIKKHPIKRKANYFLLINFALLPPRSTSVYITMQLYLSLFCLSSTMLIKDITLPEHNCLDRGIWQQYWIDFIYSEDIQKSSITILHDCKRPTEADIAAAQEGSALYEFRGNVKRVMDMLFNALGKPPSKRRVKRRRHKTRIKHICPQVDFKINKTALDILSK
jgi:hypothetical protein